MKKYVILDNIRSAYNVGSIFRTADGAGVAKIYLTGYTPAPIDRFGREQPEIQKTSLGASETVPWEMRTTTEEVIEEFKRSGIEVAAVELCAGAEDYKGYKQRRDTAYIFGNEIEGIREDILALADVTLQIPMLGRKESLNVSVAAGVVLFST